MGGENPVEIFDVGKAVDELDAMTSIIAGLKAAATFYPLERGSGRSLKADITAQALRLQQRLNLIDRQFEQNAQSLPGEAAAMAREAITNLKAELTELTESRAKA